MFCIKCGKRLSESNKYCPYCGASVFTALREHEAEVADRVSCEPHWRLRLKECRKCHGLAEPLVYFGEEGRARPLFYEDGNPASDILFVFEAPNYGDTFDPQKGRMTFGEASDPTGRFFEDCMRDELRIAIEQTMATNAVLCLPAQVDGKYPVRGKQLRLCSPNLISMIQNVDPGFLVTLGGHALKALELIERHGLQLRDAVARPHEWFGRVLFPLYHPSSLGRVSRSADQQKADYRALRSILQ